MNRSLIVSVALMVGLIVPGTGQASTATNGVFSVRCGFSHRAPDDPIVHPGRSGAAHSHDFFGNRSTEASSTYDSMEHGETTCELGEDVSAYWVPSLLDPNGNVTPVKHVFAYYRGLPAAGDPPVAYPADFRMVAGYPTVQTGTDDLLGWSCDDTSPYQATPPNCGANDLKLHIVFPNCWDGVNLDSPNHRSHVAYPGRGGCTGSYPVKLPRLAMHVTYGISNGTGYRLASDAENGTSNGRSAHADFWNTWDQPALEELVDECLRPSAECRKLTTMPGEGGGGGGGPGGGAPTCQQAAVTLTGTTQPDTIAGTETPDVVASLAGRDAIRTRGLTDRVCAGLGRDKVRGQTGADRLRGGSGADVLRGGPGNDILRGGPGRDRLWGGPGRDLCFGGAGADVTTCER
jgi:Domain of unknown function (DUF1996)/RTX calcium-binding nonapeptide repeat (4 copies)